mgnify:CR=1 FL=1|jgi:DNA-binding protein HU-beta
MDKATFNKTEFVSFIAEHHETTKAEAERSLNMILDSFIKAFHNQKGVELVGFGSFNIQHVPARDGRNPKTGEKMHINAYNKPSFRAGKKLKEACN